MRDGAEDLYAIAEFAIGLAGFAAIALVLGTVFGFARAALLSGLTSKLAERGVFAPAVKTLVQR